MDVSLGKQRRRHWILFKKKAQIQFHFTTVWLFKSHLNNQTCCYLRPPRLQQSSGWMQLSVNSSCVFFFQWWTVNSPNPCWTGEVIEEHFRWNVVPLCFGRFLTNSDLLHLEAECWEAVWSSLVMDPPATAFFKNSVVRHQNHQWAFETYPQPK